MNRRLALAIVIVTISVLELASCVQTVKSDPYMDEQAASAEIYILLLILVPAVLLGVAIVSLAIIFLLKHRRR
jgi:heme/copper-type cytochrome/quinol oxidase subunit 2